MKITNLVPPLFLVLLLSCCSSYLTSSENVSNTKNSYEKILVVGRTKDKTARIKFENQVVAKLNENGVEAAASHTIIETNDISKKPSATQLAALKQKLMNQGFDGAIVTFLINTEAYSDVVPGGSSTTYVPTRVGRFGRYLAYYPVTTWEPDQMKTGTKYIFESSLYQLRDDEKDNLQWVGRFEIKDPSNLTSTIDNYANDLVSALLKGSIQN